MICLAPAAVAAAHEPTPPVWTTRAEVCVVEVRDSEVRRFGGKRGREALGVAGEKNRGGGGTLSVELRDGGDGGGEETGRSRGVPRPRDEHPGRRRARERRLVYYTVVCSSKCSTRL